MAEMAKGWKPPRTSWRGRRRHAQGTATWLAKVKARCPAWPNDGLPDDALAVLLEALPGLARRDDRLFTASVVLLRARSHDHTWRVALNQRLAVVRRAALGEARLAGDEMVLAIRKSSWRASKDEQGQWSMHDGRSLEQFLKDGPGGRGNIWRVAVALPGVTAVEIPARHLVAPVWAEALERAKTWLQLDQPILKKAQTDGRTWNLAIRRTERCGVRGLFDPVTQTVVVDPRHPDTLFHELAHWALGHNSKIGLRRAEEEVAKLLKETKTGR